MGTPYLAALDHTPPKMSEFRNVPVYRGGVKACIFDWAGTVVDAGVFAPVLTFQKLFEDEGVPITSEEVRAPMGVHKRLHIQQICALPDVVTRWTKRHGSQPTLDDAERIYSNSLSATLKVLPANSSVIKGVAQTIARLREEFGVKIGSSTGYTSEIMAELKPLAAAQGYSPDSYVTLNMVNMDVYPAQAVVKVDDTTSGIVAGLNAGCWTVGVAKTGNYVGMTEQEMEKADGEMLSRKIDNARNILYKSGAHFVIETTNDLPEVIAEINKRMKMGLKP